jgi:hypothetical protein
MIWAVSEVRRFGKFGGSGSSEVRVVRRFGGLGGSGVRRFGSSGGSGSKIFADMILIILCHIVAAHLCGKIVKKMGTVVFAVVILHLIAGFGYALFKITKSGHQGQ